MVCQLIAQHPKGRFVKYHIHAFDSFLHGFKVSDVTRDESKVTISFVGNQVFQFTTA
jgi:hypothetical protein